MTLGEIQAGVELTRRQGASKAPEIETRLELISQSHHVLPMDSATPRVRARLMHRRHDTLHEDTMIAATAKVHSLTVVTGDMADFANFDVQVLNPFETPQD